MLRFVDQDSSFIIDKSVNGFLTQLIHRWSPWGINATASYYSCSSVLKFLQLINSSRATACCFLCCSIALNSVFFSFLDHCEVYS